MFRFTHFAIAFCLCFSAIAGAGQIKGKVNFCGNGGEANVVVHLPGRSFSARTDHQGRFHLNHVPPGKYSLGFLRLEEQIRLIKNVRVKQGGITQLGVVDIDNPLYCDSGCVCPEIFAPVCGVDGITYENACYAECINVSVVTEGACDDEVLCPAIYDPVCGVDGQTYPSACEARNIEIKHSGECKG